MSNTPKIHTIDNPIYNIEEIDEVIESRELRDNLRQLQTDVIDLIIKLGGIPTNDDDSVYNKEKGYLIKSLVDKLLYQYVIGVGKPICISDSSCSELLVWFVPRFTIELSIDYKITYGYKPYQELDKPIHISFDVNKQVVTQRQRELKLDTILEDGRQS